MSNSRSEAPRSLIGTGRIFWNSEATEEKPWLPHYGGYLVHQWTSLQVGRTSSRERQRQIRPDQCRK